MMHAPRPVHTGLLVPVLLGVWSCAPTEAPSGEEVGPDTMPATATTAPDADIWVGALSEAEGRLVLGEVRNVTDRIGYDNQPHFLPDGTLLYTRQEAGQTDIWRYDPADDGHTRVTATEVESEYSATLIPGSRRFSVIRVEGDGTQRLWSFALDEGPAELVFSDLAPVGYHAWADAETAYLFILGSPATLHLARRGSPGSTELASDIGRSIRSVPGTRRVSYVQRTGEGSSEIRVVEPGVAGSALLAPGLAGGDYHAWTPDGRILQAQGNALFVHATGDATAGWEEVGSVSPDLVITRIAVSPDGQRVALVAEPATDG